MIFEGNFHVSQTEVPIDTPSADDQKSDEQKPIYHSDLLVVIGSPKAPYGLDQSLLITNSLMVTDAGTVVENVRVGKKFKSETPTEVAVALVIAPVREAPIA